MKDFEKEFIDFMGSVFSRFGLDQLSSQIVGMIFLEPGAVAMEDIAKRTGYSLASISNKMKLLESHMMVKRVRKPGTKKAFYYIEKDVYAMMRRKIQNLHTNFISPAKTTLPEIINKNKSSKLTKEERQKLDIIQKYHRQLLEVEKCMLRMVKELEKK